MLHAVSSTSTTKKSNKKTYLTNDQMEAVAKYVINEGRGVELNILGEFVKFRVSRIDLANECQKHFGWDIGTHQIDKAIKWFLTESKRFKQPVELVALPAAPSVENNMDKIEINKLKAEIQKLENICARQSKSLDEQRETLKQVWILVRGKLNLDPGKP